MIFVVASLGFARSASAQPPAIAEIPGSPWERTIQAFEAEDKANPPKPGGVIFLGSSSIRLWNLKNAFPETAAVNRGFGGSQIADAVEFAERILAAHRPSRIVFYAGDNDIAAGKSAERVLQDFQAFVAKVHRLHPETRIAFLAIKPSPARWKFLAVQNEANRRIEAFTRTDRRLQYVDIVKPMLNAEGQPRPELFARDNLHLSPAGYALWNETVRPLLAEKP